MYEFASRFLRFFTGFLSASEGRPYSTEIM